MDSASAGATCIHPKEVRDEIYSHFMPRKYRAFRPLLPIVDGFEASEPDLAVH